MNAHSTPQEAGREPRTGQQGTNTGLWWCGSCRTTLTGLSTCHCSLCCQTFGGLDGFDAHQPGKCIDATTLRYGPTSAHAGKPKYISARRTGQGFDYPVVVSASYDHQHRTGEAHDTEAGH